MKIRGALIAGSVLSLASGTAAASGFGVSYQSVSAMGTAYAGSAVLSEDATNQWYNPATLAGLNTAEVSIAAHQVWIDTTFEANGASGPGDFRRRGAVRRQRLPGPAVQRPRDLRPGHQRPLRHQDRIRRQLGVTPCPRPAYRPPGDFYAQTSDVQTININPAVGIQITDNLRLGAGVNYQQIDADIENAATRLEGDDDAFGWNVGLTYSPDEFNHFGVAYRSEISYDIDGDITFKPGAFPGVPGAIVDQLAGQYSGETGLDLPAVLQLSYAGDLTDRTQLLLGVETYRLEQPGSLGY